MTLNKDIAFNGLFWSLYFLYQWLGLASLYGDYNSYFINACMALPVSLIFSMLAVHVFFRRYYQQGRKTSFWLGVIFSSCLLLLIRRYFNYYIIYPRYFPMALNMPLFSAGKFLVDFVNLYAISSLYALYYSVRFWYQEKHHVQELLQQRTLAELDLLKSQVQPHFVFNTLNNIYSTALKTSPETAILIAHLSGFLSYSLYDASKNTIALAEEIDYIKSYIELQKNRYGGRVDIAVNVFGNIEGLQLAPLLLLPLVENCFKHGVGDSIEKSWVRIDVTRQADRFSITIENSCDDKTRRITPDNNGIGLVNVKKRLQLIYPNQHNLKIIQGQNTYLVILEIQN
ncbi:Histidine kinase [Mucilaginibacter gossypiicola]|uniref:Histidine kinase n=1 Tax=Mucilaginibacter gossypiicola TaxID=551995 RepID=A0A1H8UK76_9SPHI|nr:histidine kinase [Mucilaginibacter gossypiicola]SEP03619.1 Histidine kinase [Mucilaginibacter gossypiicola]